MQAPVQTAQKLIRRHVDPPAIAEGSMKKAAGGWA